MPRQVRKKSYNSPKENLQYGKKVELKRRGKWLAELAHSELYSEGLIFIMYEDTNAVPAYFRQTILPVFIPEPENLMLLIDEVSRAMVAGLTCSRSCRCKCQNVYVVSLNESDFKEVQNGKAPSLGIHFRLLPRYQHDMGFLSQLDNDGNLNDGLALMAEWRRQYLHRERIRRRTKETTKERRTELDDFPQPWDDKDTEKQKKYMEYAERTLAQIRNAVEPRDRKTDVER